MNLNKIFAGTFAGFLWILILSPLAGIYFYEKNRTCAVATVVEVGQCVSGGINPGRCLVKYDNGLARLDLPKFIGTTEKVCWNKSKFTPKSSNKDE